MYINAPIIIVPTVPIATPITTPFFQDGLLKSSKKFSKKPNASSKTRDTQKIRTKEFHYKIFKTSVVITWAFVEETAVVFACTVVHLAWPS